MKALRIYQDAVVKVEDVLCDSLKENSVKVRVKACGICGSDIPRVLNNKAHYYPITLGHEFSGIVEEIGIGVENVKPGDHVVGAPLLPCMECIDCKQGNYSLCKKYKFIGSSLSGAMAEYVVLPACNVIKISENIDFVTAAFTEPLTVALHGLKQNAHQPGKKVAVLGLGTIGCLTLQAVRAAGAERITVFVRNSKHDELAQKLGADSIVHTCDANWREQISELTVGRGYDFVYETAGAVQTIQQAFEVAANKARVCMIGTPKESVTFDVKLWEMMNRKEFYLTGSWMSYSGEFPGNEWKLAVQYLAEGKIIIVPEMIHRTVALEKAQNIFEDYWKTGSIAGRNVITVA